MNLPKVTLTVTELFTTLYFGGVTLIAVAIAIANRNVWSFLLTEGICTLIYLIIRICIYLDS